MGIKKRKISIMSDRNPLFDAIVAGVAAGSVISSDDKLRANKIIAAAWAAHAVSSAHNEKMAELSSIRTSLMMDDRRREQERKLHHIEMVKEEEEEKISKIYPWRR